MFIKISEMFIKNVFGSHLKSIICKTLTKTKQNLNTLLNPLYIFI